MKGAKESKTEGVAILVRVISNFHFNKDLKEVRKPVASERFQVEQNVETQKPKSQNLDGKFQENQGDIKYSEKRMSEKKFTWDMSRGPRTYSLVGEFKTLTFTE